MEYSYYDKREEVDNKTHLEKFSKTGRLLGSANGRVK